MGGAAQMMQGMQQVISQLDGLEVRGLNDTLLSNLTMSWLKTVHLDQTVQHAIEAHPCPTPAA